MTNFEINFDSFKIGGNGSDFSRDPLDDAHHVRAAKSIKTIPHNKMIRIISDKNIEDLLPWHFEKNAAYHCMSYGGIDEWSYLKFILKQQRLRYCLVSTWIVSPDDAEEILAAVKAGLIERLDIYAGDLFYEGNRDRGAYKVACEAVRMTGGRVATFHNHCKIIVGFGDRFDFVSESSANMNVNLRLEQTTIFTDRALALWYKEYFDDIYSFNRDFDDWRAWNEDGEGNVQERQPGHKGSGDHTGGSGSCDAKKNRKTDRNIRRASAGANADDDTRGKGTESESGAR